jgi:type III pantothenate kinase
VGASVVPPLESILEELARKHLKLPIQMVNYKTIPIVIKINNPEEVGADRLVDAYAARELYGKPAIVIDFGTATTFDAISEKGEYLGGAIAPGLGIGRDALYEKTARLPKVDLHAPKHVIGNGTDEAIRSGLLIGYTGLVEKLVSEFQKELGSKCKVVGTGGFADLMAEQTKVIQIKDPDLTLKGLALLAA